MANELIKGCPVEGFDMEYEWHTGDWEKLFDRQIALVRSDVRRAKMSDKLVVYLSCPISSRGGGHDSANVDIALATQRRLLDDWGEGVWILNPANYQMESRAGTGLMNQHAEEEGIDLEALIAETGRPSGGDYMRMWTKILVENGEQVGRATHPAELVNSGQFFDAYYFLGPSDMRSFFVKGNESMTAAVESYFARRMESDPAFRDRFSVAGIDWARDMKGQQNSLRDHWRQKRNEFLRFYLFRAGANYSLGCHDEWNIFMKLNAKRRELAQQAGIGEQIAGFFEGKQIDPASTETGLARGYQR